MKLVPSVIRWLIGASLVSMLSSTGCSDAEPAAVTSEPDSRPTPTEIDEEEAARLRALGYVHVSPEAAPERVGVVRHDREAAQPGLNYYTNAFGCSSRLISMEGQVLRSWSREPCFAWGNSVLLPGGDVLVVHQAPRDHAGGETSAGKRSLLRLDPEGRLLWSRKLPAHHDVDLTPDGRVATLTFSHALESSIHPSVPVRDHQITVLDSQGESEARLSVLELLSAAPEPFRLEPVEARFSRREQAEEVDLIHANSIEWMRWTDLFGTHPVYGASHLLLSLRHQNAVVIVDWEARAVVWTWGQGELSGPHDATLLVSGNVLVFDNGLGRDWSRVVEVDPRTNEIVWEYRAPPGDRLYSVTRGAAQRLANGNTLITDSERGRAFEVTPSGEIVWDFHNPDLDEKGHSFVIVRMRRLAEPDAPEGPFAWFD